MRKPNPSSKARKATNARGKKRSDRAKETQALKHMRNALNKNQKKKAIVTVAKGESIDLYGTGV